MYSLMTQTEKNISKQTYLESISSISQSHKLLENYEVLSESIKMTRPSLLFLLYTEARDQNFSHYVFIHLDM